LMLRLNFQKNDPTNKNYHPRRICRRDGPLRSILQLQRQTLIK
jgi:hypothetical protein